MSHRKQQGFTLVEIMIVVLIIGILLAIAIPNFLQAREASRANSCVANLYQINSAKLQCIMDYKISGTDTTTKFFIDGTTTNTPGNYQLINGTGGTGYIRRVANCPSGGNYTVGNVVTAPTCDVTGAAGSGYAMGEKWYHGLHP